MRPISHPRTVRNLVHSDRSTRPEVARAAARRQTAVRFRRSCSRSSPSRPRNSASPAGELQVHVFERGALGRHL